jgi:glycosyltransferase involved in cell wall biosynthesis/predicted Zn-dependent protease
MKLRCLFGPVDLVFGNEKLADQRTRGECLTFHSRAGADLSLSATDTWESVCQKLPEGWQPDFLALHVWYSSTPAWVWDCPLPVVALAGDWNLQFHALRRMPAVELTFTDCRGVELLGAAGLGEVLPADLYGLAQPFLDYPWPPEAARDIDLVYVGYLNQHIHRPRLPWLARLARLGNRHRVVIEQNVFGDAYCALLGRAKIAFNRTLGRVSNRRVWESIAAGALLFVEEDNLELPRILADKQECVYFNEGNLEELVDHYLTHEEERQRITTAARARLAEHTFAATWDRMALEIERRWPVLVERVQQRRQLSPAARLIGRVWQRLTTAEPDDPTLGANLAAALTGGPADAHWHNALGLLGALAGFQQGAISPPALAQALGHFRRAVAADPHHPVVRLNLAEALMASGAGREATEHATATLNLLGEVGADPLAWEAVHFPPGFDLFRVEWERAAWEHPADQAGEIAAKRTLLRWRAHTLLAELTGQRDHFYEAVLARPDLPVARAALGCALGRAGQLGAARPHLERAVADNPFDLAATRALAEVYKTTGAGKQWHQLRAERRLLHQAVPKLVPAEEWFALTAPRTGGLASIIILCCNQLDCTRQCLESLLLRTRRPYELILVDNGSSDGTPAYLDALRQRSGPERVVLLRNEQNVGFAGGCNQGLAAAAGEFLVLLNNDVILTDGWLDGLVRWALHEWPKNGLVGAVTNWAGPPQEIPTDYRTIPEMEAFAAARRRQFSGQALEAERLVGFCLLLRRDVLDRVGVLDERFSLGYFEDDDLSVRVGRAGYRLVVAQEVFIHHYGGRTFAGLGLDAHQQLHENFAKFKEKWGEEQTRHYRLPERPPTPAAPLAVASGEADGQVVAAPAPRMDAPETPAPQGPESVSLIMIVKNEEENLPACLESARDLFEQIVILDTGSTDRTKEIARSFGALVVDFAWVDSFAAARTEGLRHATGTWVMWLDADEVLDPQNRDKLRQLFARLPASNVAFTMRQSSPLAGSAGAAVYVDQVRLFRNQAGLAWDYRVHEQILPGLRACGAALVPTDIVIQHSGFSHAPVQGAKVDRNLRLLELEWTERPNDAFVLYNLGAVYLGRNQPQQALGHLQRSLQCSAPNDTLVPKLYGLVLRAQQQLGQRAAARQTCAQGRATCPQDAELMFWEAVLCHEDKDLAGCERSLLAILRLPRTGVCFTSADAGLYSYRTRHFLAEVYREQSRLAEAEAQWTQATIEAPGFTPAWQGLARLWAEQGRWTEVERAAAALEQHTDTQAEAQHLRDRRPPAQPAVAAAPDSSLAAGMLRPAHGGATTALVMMVKNEEANLPDCMESARGLFDQIVIMDTGSTDRTKEIAAAYGALVVDCPWDDSFSAARNAGLDQATCDFVFWLDADDRLDEANREKLRTLLASLDREPVGYIMKCLCLPDPVTKTTTQVDHLRLFRHVPGTRWRFRVHEQILPALREIGALIRRADVVIHHVGYRDPELRARKLQRDLRLLLLEYQEQPENPFTLFNLGATHREQGQLAEAIVLFQKSLARSLPTDSIVRKLYVLLAQSQRQVGRANEALATVGQGRGHFPDDPELLFQEGLAHKSLGDRQRAIASWKAVLQAKPDDYLSSVEVGLVGHLTHHNLATTFDELGQPDDAEHHWRAALADRPDYEPALVGVAEHALRRQQWAEVESLVGRLDALPAPLSAGVMRARLHLARREFDAARAVLQQVIADHPLAVWPRVILAHVLLQQGQDWAAAEQALRDVLALDPGHAECLHNLNVLLRQQGKPVDPGPMNQAG